MRKTIFQRIFVFLGMFILVILLFSCPEPLQLQKQHDKAHEQRGMAAVSISVTDSQARSVFPQVSLEDVASYKLLGGRDGATETELSEFTTGTFSVSLEPGKWNFTLNAYNSSGGHILQGKIQNKQI